MSDMRTKYLMGTTIASIAVLIGLVAALPLADSISFSTAAPTAMMYGHGTVIITHPDGSTIYAQMDNIVLDQGIDAIAGTLVGSSSGTASATPFNFMKLMHTAAPALSSGAIVAADRFDEAAVQPTTSVETGVVTANANPASTVELIFPQVTIADGSGDDGSTDGNTLLFAVTLNNDVTSTITLLWLDLSAECPTGCAVVTGTTVDVQIDVTFTG